METNTIFLLVSILSIVMVLLLARFTIVNLKDEILKLKEQVRVYETNEFLNDWNGDIGELDPERQSKLDELYLTMQDKENARNAAHQAEIDYLEDLEQDKINARWDYEHMQEQNRMFNLEEKNHMKFMNGTKA